MSSPKFTLEVVTPGGVVFKHEVISLRAPGFSGQFGVLAHHAPMLTALNVGFIEAKDESETYYLAMSGGFSEVLPHKTIILAQTAELKEKIDVERAHAALERARKRLSERKPETDFERAQLALIRALNRLKVAELN